MRRIFFLLAALFLSVAIATAQSPTALTPEPSELKIGDQCPDLEFANMVNWPKATLKLSDFKGKLVLIDFWATWCGPCVASMPHLAEVQKELGEQVRVLQTTYEDKSLVDDFLVRKKLKELNLPTATSDRLTKKYFPHGSIPHVIWIAGNGKVIAITKSDYVTKSNIEKFLATGEIDVVNKKDILDSDSNLPFMAGGLGSYQLESSMIQMSRTIIRGKMEGLSGGGPMLGIRKNENEPIRLGALNSSVSQAYCSAFINLPKLGEKGYEIENFNLLWYDRVLWKAKDSSYFYWPGRKITDFLSVPEDKRFFSYELIVSAADSLEAKAIMVADLNAYFGKLFGIKGSLERTPMKCWVLSLTDSNSKKKLQTKGGTPQLGIENAKKYVKVVNNSFRAFMNVWWGYCFDSSETRPIIDETGLGVADKVDFYFDGNPSNMEDMKKGLAKVGVSLKLENRAIDMIVIRDL